MKSKYFPYGAKGINRFDHFCAVTSCGDSRVCLCKIDPTEFAVNISVHKSCLCIVLVGSQCFGFCIFSVFRALQLRFSLVFCRTVNLSLDAVSR